MYLQYLNITTNELHNHEQKGRDYDVHEKGHEENTHLNEGGETSRTMKIIG
jgi:hypothetical protein